MIKLVVNTLVTSGREAYHSAGEAPSPKRLWCQQISISVIDLSTTYIWSSHTCAMNVVRCWHLLRKNAKESALPSKGFFFLKSVG